MTSPHWVQWHDEYGDPTSSLSRRLIAVQRRLREALDATPEGPIRLASMCAGQGRDVIGVLTDHPRRADVQGCLVELDPNLVADAQLAAAQAGLRELEIVEGDASTTSAYSPVAPMNVVLICGVFGNIPDEDIRATITELPRLCAMQATVIWTRHRRPPDFTPTIRQWFAETGFHEVGFDTEEGTKFGVGTHRFMGHPLNYRPGQRMFTFIGDGADAHY